MTSGLYRTDTSCFVFSNFGRPRKGTIDFNRFAVNGCASGSRLAAATMALSSFGVGMRTEDFLDGLDIVFHLATRCPTQTDDAPQIASIDEGCVVEDFVTGRERDHSQLVVVEAVVDPDQRGIPIELRRKRQGDTMQHGVRLVLGGVELDLHVFIV